MTQLTRPAAADSGVGADRVRVSLVTSQPEARAAVRALASVWARPEDKAPLPPELAWALAHSGNYVAVAYEGELIVGAAVAFWGADDEGDYLHSHIVGVLPSHQGASIGFLLKQHQRDWAREAGLDRITWTFDPLVTRNAYFNVAKLGARVTRYFADFYGPLDDGINSGDETDRCLATWRLNSDAAILASQGVVPSVDIAELQRAGAQLRLSPGDDGYPQFRPARAEVQLVQLPADIVGVRRSQPALARAWRLALREALVFAFADGREVVGVSRDACYVLAPRIP